MKKEDINAKFITESMQKHFDEESKRFFKEAEGHFEIRDLMDSLQGWCLNKMLDAKSGEAKQLLQALNDWAEEKPFFGK